MHDQIFIFFQIVLIDLVLAGDNAIIIGMVASKFKKEEKNKIIFWGISAAVVLRIIFTLITAVLLQIEGLRLIGGILLLYITYKLYQDIVSQKHNKNTGPKIKKSTFLNAVMTVIIADVVMSLDNILGVAGAARDHYYLLIFGLMLSIALMAFAANLVAKWIKKHKWIGWLGLIAILLVAIDLIYTDLLNFI
jgi:YjbE family integral membrane protein